MTKLTIAAQDQTARFSRTKNVGNDSDTESAVLLFGKHTKQVSYTRLERFKKQFMIALLMTVIYMAVLGLSAAILNRNHICLEYDFELDEVFTVTLRHLLLYGICGWIGFFMFMHILALMTPQLMKCCCLPDGQFWLSPAHRPHTAAFFSRHFMYFHVYATAVITTFIVVCTLMSPNDVLVLEAIHYIALVTLAVLFICHCFYVDRHFKDRSNAYDHASDLLEPVEIPQIDW